MSRSAPSSVSTKSWSAFDAGEQAHEIVLAAKREHRIDQIVPDPRLALLDLQPIGEEIEKLIAVAVEPMRSRAVARLAGTVCECAAKRLRK